MGKLRAADDLEGVLSKLWELRTLRDYNWQGILNHTQGMLKLFFAEKQVESLTVEQCQSVFDLVDRYLGPSTKTEDDLVEVTRLIEDAGGDPFGAISGEPENPIEE